MNSDFLDFQQANQLIFAFLWVGFIMAGSFWLSKKIRLQIPAVALAVFIGLLLALLGEKKGLSDIPLFSGLGVLGGAMFRDFSIVATAMGADITQMKRAGLAGTLSLLIGVTFSFFMGVTMAWFLGYTDPKVMATLGAGACTYIVGPVTGGALGVSSDIMAMSVAIGLIKVIVTTIATPFLASRIGLDNPKTAMVYGGLLGTTSGVTAGLAATNEKLVPYGALTATFYTGLGCLACPSILYYIISILM